MSKLDARVIARMAKDREERNDIALHRRLRESQAEAERKFQARIDRLFPPKLIPEPKPKRWWQ
ncbi:hypothetical protein [Rhodococcus sp. 06-156-3C]|uniref:hypothetical protein n=1 Tax=Rhodococcus sp. 06-156-3C TaxID=2022486 RepID=UPI0011402FEA|nr:hypothetical protein [Rhodococcus sp. 06-156-3C]